MQRLTFGLVASVVLASLLAPLLADCIHSLLIFNRGIRVYQSELGYIMTPHFWWFLAGRMFVTFLVLIAAIRFGLRGRLTWLVCCLGWLWLDLEMGR